MPYLSRIRINPLRAESRKLLASPRAMHAAVQGDLPGLPEQARTLWRLDPDNPHRPHLLVLTTDKPDWTHLVEAAGWPGAEGEHYAIRDYTPSCSSWHQAAVSPSASQPTPSRTPPAPTNPPPANRHASTLEADGAASAWATAPPRPSSTGSSPAPHGGASTSPPPTWTAPTTRTAPLLATPASPPATAAPSAKARPPRKKPRSS